MQPLILLSGEPLRSLHELAVKIADVRTASKHGLEPGGLTLITAPPSLPMFNPSKEQVRLFFTDAWRKHKTGGVLTPLETMAAELIELHPEYHQALEDPNAAQADYAVEQGQTNPFLHLSMHLAINEQLSIDQPPGIKAAYQGLLGTRDPHQAAHVIMEALGEVVWEAQRLGKPLDTQAYIELIRKHATRMH